MHNRTAIRGAVETLLTGLATPLALYVERRHRLDPELLPAVLMSLGDCEAQPGNRAMGGGFVVEWQQSLSIEIHATGATGDVVAPVLDQIELEIEAALGSDLTLGGIAEIIDPQSSELEMNTDQDRVLAVRTILYNVTWRAPFGSPDSPEA